MMLHYYPLFDTKALNNSPSREKTNPCQNQNTYFILIHIFMIDFKGM